MDKEKKIIFTKRDQRAKHDRCNEKTCFFFYFFEVVTMAIVKWILFDRPKADEKAYIRYLQKQMYINDKKSFRENSVVNPRSVLNFQSFPRNP